MRDTTHWVGTWTAAPAPAEGAAFANHTLRMTPRVSIGGSRLRVRISNAYGVRPLAIGGARVGLRGTGPAVVAGSNRRLTFGGEPTATIAAGALVVSDPVDLTFAPLAARGGISAASRARAAIARALDFLANRQRSSEGGRRRRGLGPL